MHKTIYELGKHTNFGYDAIYSMPSQLRTFYIGQAMAEVEKNKAKMDADHGKQEAQPQKMARGPAINRS